MMDYGITTYNKYILFLYINAARMLQVDLSRRNQRRTKLWGDGATRLTASGHLTPREISFH